MYICANILSIFCLAAYLPILSVRVSIHPYLSIYLSIRPSVDRSICKICILKIANVETRTEQSTEVAEDLEYPDDDMSEPATTLMKYKDIMPDADVLKVLADQVRKVRKFILQ